MNRPHVRGSGRRTRRIAALPLALLAFCAAGCSDSRDFIRDDLRTARALWDEAGAADYSFRFERDCVCDPSFTTPVRVTVQADTVASVVRIAGTEDIPLDEARDRAFTLTVPDLFGIVEEALEDDVFNLSVGFDLELGYPRRIVIDADEDDRTDRYAIATDDLLFPDPDGSDPERPRPPSRPTR